MRCAYMSRMDRTTNLLGAVALALTDQIRVAMAQSLTQGGETAAAVIVLGYAPGLSVEILRQVIDRSHAGAVRLVDRLAREDLVERRKAKDGRAVALHLTGKGKRLRAKLMADRLDKLETSLSALSESERETFGELLAKVLSTLPETEMDKHRICRLCSVPTCKDCPIPGHAI